MADANNYAVGNWTVKEGSVDDFLSRWREFLEWTRGSAGGFQQAHLLRNQSDNRRFVSYSTWDDVASQQRWRAMPEFAQKLGPCQALCDDFHNDVYERAITIG